MRVEVSHMTAVYMNLWFAKCLLLLVALADLANATFVQPSYGFVSSYMYALVWGHTVIFVCVCVCVCVC